MRTIADKQISDLVAATSVQTTDLFVLEQTGTAKKLTGRILTNFLLTLADGHGGIQSWAKTGSSGLTDTYTMTLADGTTYQIAINNGRSITGLVWTESGTPRDGAEHLGTFSYNDGTESTIAIYDGEKGDTGDAWYVWFKFASDLPTSDADLSDYPDNYIGLYSGTSSTAPAHYTDYTWFRWKGDKGNTGDAATIASQSVTYLASSSGTVVPEGSWQTNVPTVAPGNFLWTRTRVTYNSGDIVTSYSISRFGIDGSGSVSSVNEISPDSNGNVALTASDVPTSDSTSVQAKLDALDASVSDLETYEVHHVTGTISALPASFSYSWITADHRVINCVFGNPQALTSDVTWTTSAGDITFSGTMANLATTTIDFDIVKTL